MIVVPQCENGRKTWMCVCVPIHCNILMMYIISSWKGKAFTKSWALLITCFTVYHNMLIKVLGHLIKIINFPIFPKWKLFLGVPKFKHIISLSWYFVWWTFCQNENETHQDYTLHSFSCQRQCLCTAHTRAH